MRSPPALLERQPPTTAIISKFSSSIIISAAAITTSTRKKYSRDNIITTTSRSMAANDDTAKAAAPTAAKSVTGEELEKMLQEWDTPLVIDAYATWCGPCLLMAPEFEIAASSLLGKVRFVKLDTDLEPQMASRLGIMGLPTLLFLDKNREDAEAVAEGKAPAAVLKERIEGALRQQSIVDLCEYHFFDGPMPTSLS